MDNVYTNTRVQGIHKDFKTHGSKDKPPAATTPESYQHLNRRNREAGKLGPLGQAGEGENSKLATISWKMWVGFAQSSRVGGGCTRSVTKTEGV